MFVSILDAQIIKCTEDKKVCSVLYKTGMSREVYIVNQSNESIIVNATAYIPFQKSSSVNNIKLDPNQNYKLLRVFFYNHETFMSNIHLTTLNYKINDYKQEINIYKDKTELIGKFNDKNRVEITTKILERKEKQKKKEEILTAQRVVNIRENSTKSKIMITTRNAE